MSAPKLKRQFIAGATCPECNQQDKIQRVDDGNKVWMECVSCGMVRNLDEQSVQKTAEILDEIARPVTLRSPTDPKKVH